MDESVDFCMRDGRREIVVALDLAVVDGNEEEDERVPEDGECVEIGVAGSEEDFF